MVEGTQVCSSLLEDLGSTCSDAGSIPNSHGGTGLVDCRTQLAAMACLNSPAGLRSFPSVDLTAILKCIEDGVYKEYSRVLSKIIFYLLQDRCNLISGGLSLCEQFELKHGCHADFMVFSPGVDVGLTAAFGVRCTFSLQC